MATPAVRPNGREREDGVMSVFSPGAFCCAGFLTLYLSGKLQIFRPPGRGQAWRLCVVMAPLLTACTASLTRIQDNKHHWEGLPHTHCSTRKKIHNSFHVSTSSDVTVGGSIGMPPSIACPEIHVLSSLQACW